MLAIQDLVVRYGRIAALRAVSLHVEEGEIVSVVGPNGAGKSSLLGAVAGIVPVAEGSITFEGRSLVGSKPETTARLGVSLVPEGRHIFAKLTVLENLRLGLSAKGRTDSSQIDDALDRFPALKRFLRSSAGKLSGGEQQQLAIARALVARPRLMLLDEPSLGLAPMIVEGVLQTLRELRDSGITILLVEQFAAQARAMADRTYVLGLGKVVLEASRDDEISSEGFEAAYLGARTGREHT